MPPSQPTVGFIGLGHMGSGMTRNLLRAGFPLVVNDIRRESADPLLAGGTEWADSVAAVAASTDLVITMLPTPRHVAEVTYGRHGILAWYSRRRDLD